MDSPGRLPLTLSDRLMAAGLTALFVTATLLVLPLAVFVLTRGHLQSWLPVLGHFPEWAGAVVALAAIYGFMEGPDRATELMAHWWFTAKPRSAVLSLGLWAIVAAIAVVTNLLLR